MSLLERIAKLELEIETEKKSIKTRTTKWMSFSALVISLIAGGYGLADQFYYKYYRDADIASVHLREVAARLIEINWQLASLQFDNKLAALDSISRIANLEKVSLLSYADYLLTKYSNIPNFVDAGVYITLSAENLNLGSNTRALSYASKAVSYAESAEKNSKEDITLTVESMRYAARAQFAPGPNQDIPAARKLFTSALNKAVTVTTFVRTGMIVNVYGDSLWSEANFGDCAVANRMLAEMPLHMAKYGLTDPQAWQIIETSLKWTPYARRCSGTSVQFTPALPPDASAPPAR